MHESIDSDSSLTMHASSPFWGSTSQLNEHGACACFTRIRTLCKFRIYCVDFKIHSASCAPLTDTEMRNARSWTRNEIHFHPNTIHNPNISWQYHLTFDRSWQANGCSVDDWNYFHSLRGAWTEENLSHASIPRNRRRSSIARVFPFTSTGILGVAVTQIGRMRWIHAQYSQREEFRFLSLTCVYVSTSVRCAWMDGWMDARCDFIANQKWITRYFCRCVLASECVADVVAGETVLAIRFDSSLRVVKVFFSSYLRPFLFCFPSFFVWNTVSCAKTRYST